MQQEQSKPRQIISVYIDLLVDAGVRAASLDAVAREVNLSKAGLLHHFPSRRALDAGLLSHVSDLVDVDIAAMRDAPCGAVHYYLASSFEAESELERAVVAATRLAQSGSEAAGETLRSASGRWYRVLVEETGDPLLAKFVLLAGDGVSYHTDIAPGQEQLVTRGDITAFVGLVDRLQKVPRPPDVRLTGGGVCPETRSGPPGGTPSPGGVTDIGVEQWSP